VPSAGDILRKFYDAVIRRDLVEARRSLRGKSSHVESAFDGRPFAAMFGGGKR
jgi:hypothetical protein